MAEINQTLDVIFIGEDVSIPFTLTSTTTPAAWTITVHIKPLTGLEQTSTGVVSGSAGANPAWTATVTATFLQAKTKLLGPGVAVWQGWRTDSGSVTMLGEGTIEIRKPRIEIT